MPERNKLPRLPPPPSQVQPLESDYGVYGLLPEGVKAWISTQAERYPMGIWGAIMRNFQPGQGPLRGMANMAGELATVDPGMGPAPLGMLLTERNLPIFLRKMGEHLLTTPGTKADVGVAFNVARYPKRGEILTREAALGDTSLLDLLGSRQGSFSPASVGMDQATSARPITLYDLPRTAVREQASTAAHEAQHYIDYARRKGAQTQGRVRTAGSPVEELDFVPVTAGGRYVNTPMTAYREQPVEARAFRAGETAAKQFDKLMDLVNRAYGKPLKILDLAEPITRKDVNNALDVAVSAGLRPNLNRVTWLKEDLESVGEGTVTWDRLFGAITGYRHPSSEPFRKLLSGLGYDAARLPTSSGLHFAEGLEDPAITLKKAIFRKELEGPGLSTSFRAMLERK